MTPPAAPRAIHPREILLAAFVALAALVALRPCGLGVPFWWDAGAVYAPGARWLMDHGFAARPGVFPSDLSRGHTHLFYLVTAAAFRLFGATPTVGHGLVLAFSSAALALTYALGARLFSRPVGALAAALLAVSPLYLTMSSETLPEVPITALTVASLYAFARGRVRESAAWGCALVLFKETGVASPLAIAGAILLHALRTRSLRARLPDLLWASLPVAVLGAFFLWQKAVEGWFVLPYHADLFRERHSLGEQFVRVARSIFTVDGRVWVTVSALAVALWRRVRGAPLFDTPPPSDETERPTVLTALGLVTLANLGFFTKMFFLERYALPAHPGVLIVIAALLCPSALRARELVRLAPALVTLALALRSREAGTGYASGELTFRYLHAVRAHQALFRHLDAQPRAPVILSEWPMTDELRHPFLGWVSRPYRVVSLSWYRTHGHDARDGGPIEAIVAYDAIDSYAALRAEAQRRGLRLARRETVRGATIELYQNPVSPPAARPTSP